MTELKSKVLYSTYALIVYILIINIYKISIIYIIFKYKLIIENFILI